MSKTKESKVEKKFEYTVTQIEKKLRKGFQRPVFVGEKIYTKSYLHKITTTMRIILKETEFMADVTTEFIELQVSCNFLDDEIDTFTITGFLTPNSKVIFCFKNIDKFDFENIEMLLAKLEEKPYKTRVNELLEEA